MDEQYVPGTRSVFQFEGTTCSSGYAISNQGAVKLAAYFKDADENLDLQLSRFCRQQADLTCLGVWPQIVTAANTKSNIEHLGDKEKEEQGKPVEVKVEGGPALQYSARVNAKRIMDSGVGFVPRNEWHAEWDTCWAINPYQNHSWQMLRMNETTGDPLFFEPNKDAGEVLKEFEFGQEESNGRARRALLSDPY